MRERADALALGARRRWDLIVAFVVGHFTHHVTNSLLTPLLPLIRDSFALSYAEAGVLISAFSISQGVSQAPMGALADRVSTRAVLAAGLVGSAICSLLIGLADAYWLLLALLVALGLLAGAYHAPAAAILARVFPTERRGRVLGLHTVGGHLSFFATPLLAAALVQATGSWRSPYLLFALAPLVFGVVLWLVTPRVESSGSSAASGLGVLKDLRVVLQSAGALVGAAVLFQMIYAATIAFMALYFVDARGLSEPAAAALIAAPYAAGVFGSPLGGLLSDRFGRRAVILASLVGLGPMLYLLTVLPVELLLPGLLVLGLLASARMPVIESLILDRAPPTSRATALGAYYLLAQELGGLAAPLLGKLAEDRGIASAFTLTALAAAGLSVVLLLFSRRL